MIRDNQNIPVTLYKEIVMLLTSLPNIDDNNARRALIYNAAIDSELQSQINFGDSSTQFFQLLITMLDKYGRLRDGRNALEAVLESAKDYIGEDKKSLFDKLILELQETPALSEKVKSIPQVETPSYVAEPSKSLNNGVGISAINISKWTGNSKRIFNNISLSIYPCEFVALVGWSASGKNILFDILRGTTTANEGQVLINNSIPLNTYMQPIGYIPLGDINIQKKI